MFVGSLGADKGIPFMANEACTKAYARSLSLSLHEEFKSHGIHVTVLPPALTGRLQRCLGFTIDPTAGNLDLASTTSEKMNECCRNRLLQRLWAYR
jgi:NAD(P)-dependent dehydrogenase (short-subunit alcohol dehydrogenase family)